MCIIINNIIYIIIVNNLLISKYHIIYIPIIWYKLYDMLNMKLVLL